MLVYVFEKLNPYINFPGYDNHSLRDESSRKNKNSKDSRKVISINFREYRKQFTIPFSAGIDTGLAIYNRYHGEGTHNVGYAAHFGGALVGMYHLMYNMLYMYCAS